MRKLIFTSTALIVLIVMNYYQSQENSDSSAPAVIVPYQTEIPGENETTVLDSTEIVKVFKGTDGS